MDEKSLFYVLRTTENCPYDTETDPKLKDKVLKNVLRPEFVCNYNKPGSNEPLSLNADTIKDYVGLYGQGNSKYQFGDKDIIELSEASKTLKTVNLQNLVNKLDDLTLIPIDSESLTDCLHKHGINIRYLSHIAILSQVPHVQEICVTEMLARTCKNILNLQMSNILFLILSTNQ